MSKDQNKTIEIPVETVDNFKEMLEWIRSSIHFWHLENTYPTNLIQKVVTDFYNELENLSKKNVSLSHIIDK